jgi:FtsP/CotA-like multicopper oxidase with cupredoxin domain
MWKPKAFNVVQMPVHGCIEFLKKDVWFAFSRRCAEIIFLALVFLPVSGAEQSKNVPKHSRVRIFFVAADEVAWDYAPSGQDVAMGHEFHNLEADYMESGPHKIGRVYKKAVFREYTDARFNRLKPRSADEEYLGILGPVLYCEVGDTIKVVFLNHSSRPYSIHPHGVLYAKNAEGSGYNDGTSGEDKADDAVPPGATHTYIWQVPERAGPGPNDFSSVAWMYHSHVEELRDVASGLFGAIIVTARGKARPDGHPSDVDREVVSLMISINENESWYLDENIRKYTTDPGGVNKKESIPGGPDDVLAPGLGRGFADVNIRYTINGYMFGNMLMITMKTGERVRWYLLALGDSNNFHTPHWHGNSVNIHGHHTDVISLSPGQMETVDMIPDNPGIWLFHCHISDHMAGGMVTRYKVEP